MLIRARLSCGLPILGAGNAGRPMCVFMIGGQSNAAGFGDSSQSIVPPDDVVQFKNGAMSSAADPVGGADTGSFAPAFGSTFYSLTGKPGSLGRHPTARGFFHIDDRTSFKARAFDTVKEWDGTIVAREDSRRDAC